MSKRQWEKFEDDTKTALDELRREKGAFTYRLADSKAAGNMMKRSPGDFLFGHSGKMALLECKSSEEHSTLRTCLKEIMDSGQAADHISWQRAGCPSWVLFYSDRNGTVEAWDGADAALAWQGKAPLPSVPKKRFVKGLLKDVLLELITEG